MLSRARTDHCFNQCFCEEKSKNTKGEIQQAIKLKVEYLAQKEDEKNQNV
jgi:hypothetical protein